MTIQAFEFSTDEWCLRGLTAQEVTALIHVTSGLVFASDRAPLEAIHAALLNPAVNQVQSALVTARASYVSKFGSIPGLKAHQATHAAHCPDQDQGQTAQSFALPKRLFQSSPKSTGAKQEADDKAQSSCAQSSGTTRRTPVLPKGSTRGLVLESGISTHAVPSSTASRKRRKSPSKSSGSSAHPAKA